MFLGVTLIVSLLWAEAHFTQTRISPTFSTPQVEEGYFRYGYPDTIIWRYDNRAEVEIPAPMKRLILSAVQNNTTELDSRRFRRYFSSVDIDFSSEGVARRVILVETSGDSTIIDFSSMRYEPLLHPDTHIQ